MEPWFEAAGRLSQRLLDSGAWTFAERERASELAMKILQWGRVPQARSPEVVESVFRRALGLPCEGRPPVNSGWTRVAALATAFLEATRGRTPHVIWDSRVSTSLVSHLEPILLAGRLTDPKRTVPRIGAVPGRRGSRPRRHRLQWSTAYGSWSSQGAPSSTGLVDAQ